MALGPDDQTPTDPRTRTIGERLDNIDAQQRLLIDALWRIELLLLPPWYLRLWRWWRNRRNASSPRSDQAR